MGAPVWCSYHLLQLNHALVDSLQPQAAHWSILSKKVSLFCLFIIISPSTWSSTLFTVEANKQWKNTVCQMVASAVKKIAQRWGGLRYNFSRRWLGKALSIRYHLSKDKGLRKARHKTIGSKRFPSRRVTSAKALRWESISNNMLNFF